MQRLRRFIIHSKKRALWIGLVLVTLLVVWSILLPLAQTGATSRLRSFYLGMIVHTRAYPVHKET
jgi:hypothetical protein